MRGGVTGARKRAVHKREIANGRQHPDNLLVQRAIDVRVGDDSRVAKKNDNDMCVAGTIEFIIAVEPTHQLVLKASLQRALPVQKRQESNTRSVESPTHLNILLPRTRYSLEHPTCSRTAYTLETISQQPKEPFHLEPSWLDKCIILPFRQTVPQQAQEPSKKTNNHPTYLRSYA